MKTWDTVLMYRSPAGVHRHITTLAYNKKFTLARSIARKAVLPGYGYFCIPVENGTKPLQHEKEKDNTSGQ